MPFKRFGRKKVFLISKLAEFVIYFVIGMTQSFGSYVLLRWLEGVFVYLPYTTAFVLGLLLNSFGLIILCVVTYKVRLHLYFCLWICLSIYLKTVRLVYHVLTRCLKYLLYYFSNMNYVITNIIIIDNF